MADTVKVKVVVSEDGVEVGFTEVTYYRQQPYTVKIDTPDGVDAKVERTAGSDDAKADGGDGAKWHGSTVW